VVGNDTWEVGDAYERYVGRWSRLVARDFVRWLDCPPGLRWLDVGCGTGALSATILETRAPEALTGVDPSAGFLATARARISSPKAQFEQGEGQALPLEDGGFDTAVSGLVLNFVPDPGAMVRELRRVLRPRGTLAVYVWDYADGMQLIRRFWDAAAALDPAAKELDEGARFPICRQDALSTLFRASGLEEVATAAIEVPTVFPHFDDYWTPFLGGQGPAPSYCMSIPAARRARLRERLQSTLPVDADGRIPLIARAWAARGTIS